MRVQLQTIQKLGKTMRANKSFSIAAGALLALVGAALAATSVAPAPANTDVVHLQIRNTFDELPRSEREPAQVGAQDRRETGDGMRQSIP